jgi:DNA repair exonuclease SbcCD ATPase subunit
MSLEELRARLDSLLTRHGLAADRQDQAARLRDALVELKVAIGQNADARAKAERELEAERQRLVDAERRGSLAAGIDDAETVRIAAEFTAKHRERVELLERKLGVIRDELAFAEREYAGLSEQYRSTKLGTSGPSSSPSPAAAELDPELDRDLDRLSSEASRAARDAAVRAQLEHLKKKLGK